ncbi:MAG: molecular chaperone TorD family protein, partial [Acidimicrobiia bacterium]|nr:molecular chaperone TorD family protein [Acidimicrobiia bacterium]
MTDEVAIARLRQGLYRFFGGALIAPDEERLASLTAAANLLDAMGLEAYAFHSQWRSLSDIMRQLPDERALKAEYVRLFASGVDDSFCPPIESYYRAEAKGGGTAALVSSLERQYLALGFTPIDGSEAPDHVATELEVMSALCDREAVAWTLGNAPRAVSTLADQDRFLRYHLASWFPAFRR